MSSYTTAMIALTDLEYDRSRMARENEALARGAAKQAETIRMLREQISKLETEVALRNYDIEMIKEQGRKTRRKTRALKQDLARSRDHLGQALGRAERAEEISAQYREVAERRREDNRKLDAIIHNTKLEVTNLRGAITRLTHGAPLALEVVTERHPFQVKRVVAHKPLSFGTSWTDPITAVDVPTVEVRQSAIQLRVAPEHQRDLLAHAAIAKEAAARLCRGVEQEILNALRGDEVPLSEVDRQRYKAKMDEMTKSLSAEEHQGTPFPRRFYPFDGR